MCHTPCRRACIACRRACTACTACLPALCMLAVQHTRKPSSSSSAPATLLSCTRPSSEPLNRRVASRGWKLTWRGALDRLDVLGLHATKCLLERTSRCPMVQSAQLAACRHSLMTTEVKQLMVINRQFVLADAPQHHAGRAKLARNLRRGLRATA